MCQHFVEFSIFSAYYRGAMGILLVYDVTDESSFNSEFPSVFWLKFGDFFFSSKASSWNMTQLTPISDIRNWIRNIEQHASDNVNKILVGNKADMDESKRVCKHLGPFSLSYLGTSMQLF